MPKTILFSGRFDPPHLGHAVTVLRLLERYHKVIVVVLDYADSFCSLAHRMNVLNEVFRHLGERVEILSGPHHFAEISAGVLKAWFPPWDVYGSGNDACLQHIASLGFCVEYVPRALDYSATELRIGRQVIALVKG